MKGSMLLGPVLAAVVATTAHGVGVWTFDDQVPPWAKDVAAEAAAPTNRALRIMADKPHHTRVGLPGAVPKAFVAEARVLLQASTGDAPLAYVYALTQIGRAHV